jgi:hypothetical protein
VKPCTTCGNDIADNARRCPFCEQPQPARQARPRPVGGVPVIDLKHGMPVVADAMKHLDLSLQTMRARGVRVVRVLHGWGSTGHGGAIGVATRRQLRTLQGRGLIRAFVPGEDYSEFSTAGQEVFHRHPALKATFASDRLNRGITIVEL